MEREKKLRWPDLPWIRNRVQIQLKLRNVQARIRYWMQRYSWLLDSRRRALKSPRKETATSSYNKRDASDNEWTWEDCKRPNLQRRMFYNTCYSMTGLNSQWRIDHVVLSMRSMLLVFYEYYRPFSQLRRKVLPILRPFRPRWCEPCFSALFYEPWLLPFGRQEVILTPKTFFSGNRRKS